MTYETTWSGASWREGPQPVVMPSDDPVQRGDGYLRDHVMRGLTDQWQSIRALVARTGVPYKQLWAALQQLVRQGRIDEWSADVDGRRGRARGSVVRQYRRRTHGDSRHD